MKIIDKRKDYYDYLQGIWGQDPKAVYYRMAKDVFKSNERPEFFAKTFPDGICGYEGYISLVCGRIIHRIRFINGKYGMSMKRYQTEFFDRPIGRAPMLIEWEIYKVKRYKKDDYYRSATLSGYRENPMLISFPLTVVLVEEVFTGIQDYILSQYDVDYVDDQRFPMLASWFTSRLGCTGPGI